MRVLLLILWLGSCVFAQDKGALDRDAALRREFGAALDRDLEAARRMLPDVAGRPWLAEMNFRESCALARLEPVAEALVAAAGLRNPTLALRESREYLPLPNGRALLEKFVHAAPDEAMAMAGGASRSAKEMHALLAASESPEVALLLRLADDQSIDQPRRRRVAFLAGQIVRGTSSFDAALRLAVETPAYFARLVDLRAAADVPDGAPLERAIENESLVLLIAARESMGPTIAGDLSRFRARDLYALLALGRAEAIPEVFGPIFDRLLLPKWKSESPKASSLLSLLNQTGNWELRDFAAGAVAAQRFEAFLNLAGPELVARLVRGIDRTADPLKEGMRLAEVVDATTAPALLAQMGTAVSKEFERCREAGDLRGSTIYGLLAVKLGVDAVAAPYAPFLRSSESLDTSLLCGESDRCVERHFFYDDDDGVRSFESFLSMYQHDAAWQIEDRGAFVHLTGRGPAGRTIEIYANVPIDGHLPANRAREGEARRRQEAVAAAMSQRGIEAPILVHRGHSFWVEQTMSYITNRARLVVLGSCGGSTEVHAVLEASHDAQVIATRGVGETEINDHIVKTMNERLLKGDRTIDWKDFWKELGGRRGGGLFRDYLAPNQDAGMVFLRSYYRYLDSLP